MRVFFSGSFVVAALLMFSLSGCGTSNGFLAGNDKPSPVVIRMSENVQDNSITVPSPLCTRSLEGDIWANADLGINVHQDLLKLFEGRGIKASNSCRPAQLDVYIQQIGEATVADTDTMLAAGYGSDVKLAKFMQDTGTDRDALAWGPFSAIANPIRAGFKSSLRPSDSVYIVVVDLHVLTNDVQERKIRIVAYVPYGTPDWRSALLGPVEVKIASLFIQK